MIFFRCVAASGFIAVRGWIQWLAIWCGCCQGSLLSSFLPLRLHWLRMKPKHVLHSYVTGAIISLLGGTASNGVHSCFWDEWHWLSCLSGGGEAVTWLLPCISTGLTCVSPGCGCLGMILCVWTPALPPSRDGGNVVWVKNYFSSIFTITSHLPTREVISALHPLVHMLIARENEHEWNCTC